MVGSVSLIWLHQRCVKQVAELYICESAKKKLGFKVEFYEISDIDWHAPSVLFIGKGNKQRVCPLWATTVEQLSRIAAQRGPEQRLFLNRNGQPITRFGIHTLVERQASFHDIEFEVSLAEGLPSLEVDFDPLTAEPELETETPERKPESPAQPTGGGEAGVDARASTRRRRR